jgi:hypothetical protein
MGRGGSSADEAALAQRAIRLLEGFFVKHPNLQKTALDLAFEGYDRDPRSLLNPGAPAKAFAVECVTELLGYGCTDGRRHSLARVIEVIRDEFLGANPDPDYIGLPRLLNPECALPSRADERAHLEALLAEVKRKPDLYAPLRGIARVAPQAATEPALAAWDDMAPLRHVRRARRAGQTPVSRDFPDILSAFEEVRRAAVLGRPGAGKTTLLRKLAAQLADRALADPHAPVSLLVSLGEWTGAEAFEGFLADRCPGVGDATVALSKAKRLVLLLDGLNELPTATRKDKAGAIRDHIAELARPTPVFVSCRTDDYQGDLDLDLDTLTLQPLSPPRVRQVLHHWLGLSDPADAAARAERLFWQLAGDPALAGVLATWQAAGAAEELFWEAEEIPEDDRDLRVNLGWEEEWLRRRDVHDPRSLLRLAANPFMLTMLFWVWIERVETLSGNRGELFAEFVNALLDREHLLLPDDPMGQVRYTSEGERLLSGLGSLAWTLQGKRIAEAGAEGADLGVLTTLPRTQAVETLGEEALVKEALDATLLEGAETVRFRHQLLQEYFTAVAMREQIASAKLTATDLWPKERWWARSGWEESAVLLAGLHAEDCAPVVRWLADAQPEVAAQCVLDSGAEVADREARDREFHDAWLPRLTDLASDPEPEARAAIGRALGRLGLDDRRGVGLGRDGLPDIDWVAISEGDFIYGDGVRRRLTAFWISRYPITYAQFEAFIRDGGYGDNRWWEGLEGRIPEREAPGWSVANHPRETVTWFEAMAFCTWLSDRLGLEVTLPTEAQWERASRGKKGRKYPWGDIYRRGFAAINEKWDDAGPHDLDRTSPVGIYPQGASVEGVLDLAGNVWEWCLNEYTSPERTQRSGEGSRVLRGGSWTLDREYARADYRNFGSPDDRSDDVGFRVVCASPIRSDG